MMKNNPELTSSHCI